MAKPISDCHPTLDCRTLDCHNEQRRHEVRQQNYYGLDYVVLDSPPKVPAGQKVTLKLHFLGRIHPGLTKEHLQIEGGRRVPRLDIQSLTIRRATDSDKDDVAEIEVIKPRDLSTYTLRVTGLDGFDPRYTAVKFSFNIDCPSEMDCKSTGETICPTEYFPEPDIDYLAKDYASFRRLILDRLAVTMPDWQECHVPDLGIVMVELLAYVGDHLSYYQDAVATEAYLNTARQRISVRRHARLVDYQMHEGCNARTWLHLKVDSDLVGENGLDPAEIYFITAKNHPHLPTGQIIKEDDQEFQQLPPSQYEIFEPLGERQPIELFASHNRLELYTWGDRECYLPRGATSATLKGQWAGGTAPIPAAPPPPSACETEPELAPEEVVEAPPSAPMLHLRAGDILVFEEVIGPTTGNPADAKPAHRQAVRLSRIEAGYDPLYKQHVVEIEWRAEDALRFPLCLSTVVPQPPGNTERCKAVENISIARGNIILVDHGHRIGPEHVGQVEAKSNPVVCLAEGKPQEMPPQPARFCPRLSRGPVVFRQPLPENAPASQMLTQDPRQAVPVINLCSLPQATVAEKISLSPSDWCQETGAMSWLPQRDLLNSRGNEPHFVAEIDNQGLAHLRFGDGRLGDQPKVGDSFRAVYRLGGGPAGHVGADTISHLVTRRGYSQDGIAITPRNPLPAQGGVAPEPIAEVKLYASHAFRRQLRRAIIAEDYALLAEQHPQVQRAAARLRWTGSWHEVLVVIDQLGNTETEPSLLDEIYAYLYPFRRMGHDLRVVAAHYVSLDIKLTVCVRPNFLRGHAKAALQARFSNRRQPDGSLGFFHPDNLTFGDGISVSKLVATAQAVTGVYSVQVDKLNRYDDPDSQALSTGRLTLTPLEVPRLNNDPNFPEHGKIEFVMQGGR